MAKITQEDVEIKKIELEKLQFAAQTWFSGHALHNMELSVRQDQMRNDLIYRLRTEILAEKLKEETATSEQKIEFKTPSSWWQMFKRDYVPIWFKERYPVEMKAETKIAKFSTTFKAYELYPELPRVHQNTGRSVFYTYTDFNPAELIDG